MHTHTHAQLEALPLSGELIMNAVDKYCSNRLAGCCAFTAVKTFGYPAIDFDTKSANLRRQT